MTSHIHTQKQGALALVIAAGLFTAACGSSSNPVAPTPTPGAATVSTVVVTGAPAAPGKSFQLTATAKLTDNGTRDVTSTATWSTSNALVATVSPTGMVTINGGGELDVKATYQNMTGSLHLLTAALPVVAVNISGPSELTTSVQLTAIAKFSDGSTSDVTQSVHWDSSDPQYATVSVTGFARPIASGSVDFLATYQGVTGNLHMTVTAGPSFLVSGTITSGSLHGTPVANARVQVFTDTTQHVQSDAQGQFAVRISPGNAIIEVTKVGYDTWSELVTISGDTQMAIVLTPTRQSGTDAVDETALLSSTPAQPAEASAVPERRLYAYKP